MNRKRILVVDDERGFTSMLKLNLEATGNYEVDIENEPDQAVRTALECRPDLILLDIIMPSKEGPDVAADIRKDPKLHATPIVFLTATVTKEEVDSQGGVIGGHPFVAKPSNLAVLLHSIETNIASAY